jgi:hypothetical protein
MALGVNCFHAENDVVDAETGRVYSVTLPTKACCSQKGAVLERMTIAYPAKSSAGASFQRSDCRCRRGKSYLQSRSLTSDARARLRIMDSNETRGTLISLRISALRSRRWVALGMRAAARSKAPDDAAYIPAIAR